MNKQVDLSAGVAGAAKRKLRPVNAQVAAMRAVLVQLLQDAVRAETRVDIVQAAQLLLVNEQLVCGALNSRTKLETSAATDAPVLAPVAATSPPRELTAHEQLVAEHERSHAQLVQANERLVLAALGFDELQVAAEGVRQRRADLLQVVAQELNDPQAPTRLAAAVLGRVGAHAELMPRAQAIVDQQMDHMARTVGALLEPSAPAEAGGGSHTVFDVCALAADAVANCRGSIERHHQILDVQLAPGPIGVQGDSAQLAQALATLLDNATTYTQDGGSIQLRVEALGSSVQLSVADDGLGFGADDRATILKPFVRDPRAPDAGTASEDSFNLGLTTVRAAVEAHGGTLQASSAGKGLGSVFIVTLPLAELR